MVGYIGVTQLYLVFKTRTRVSCVVSSTCQNTQQIGWGMGYSCILDLFYIFKENMQNVHPLFTITIYYLCTLQTHHAF
jgi:hypothetical protein